MENNISLLMDKKPELSEWLSEWSVDHKTSAIRFSVAQRNFLARPFRKISGKFNVYEGLVRTKSEDFSGASIYMIIETDSISTGKKIRDKNLLSENFFDAERFPFLRFRSLSFEKGRNNNYILEGDLTIRGISNRVVVAANYKPGIDVRTGEEKLCFQSEFQVNRHDYGLQANMFFEAFIEKEITIQLNLEFSRIPDSIF